MYLRPPRRHYENCIAGFLWMLIELSKAREDVEGDRATLEYIEAQHTTIVEYLKAKGMWN